MKRKWDPKIGQWREVGKFDGKDGAPPRGGLRQLHAEVVPNRDLIATKGLMQRVSTLQAGGYVQAVAMTTRNRHLDADEESRTQWWDTSFATAEHGGKVPAMPDDYTPKMTAGRAMSGHRRTTRRKYESEDIVLRMPAVTSVKRFFAENEGGTFDIPYTAHSTRFGEMTGHARVTRSSNGGWTVNAMGLDGEKAELISSNMGHLLESRRPTTALQEYGSIADRVMFEQHAVIRSERLHSKFMKRVAYDRTSGVMMTQIGAKVYAHEVDEEVYDAVLNARAPGAIFNKLVKAGRPVTLSRCDTCRAYYSTYHRCSQSTVATGKYTQTKDRGRLATMRRRVLSAMKLSTPRK